MKRKNIITLSALFFLTAFSAVGFFYFFRNNKNVSNISSAKADVPTQNQIVINSDVAEPLVEKIARTLPDPVSMSRIKSQGCVADGLLSGYNPENDKFIALVNRSNCYYLHRGIETWLTPPDFSKVENIMNQINKKDVVYGMFIAEAINVRGDYFNTDTGREFDFKDMCKNGSENFWGEGTCQPTFSSREYRNYIQYITRKAMDLGVQSFTFGQIYMQEGTKKKYASGIMQDMRDYAKEKGVNIIIGAQTNSITDEKYLKLFDYLEGGVGIDSMGNVEDGPCLSTRGNCWALLWHDQFAGKANNVLLNLDWTGILSDDLDIFARMDKDTRAKTLKNLHEKFSTQKTGFMMPLFGVIHNENNGCRGPKKKFYSADSSYSCGDENVINKILWDKK